MTIPDWILVTYGWFLGVGAVTTILVWGLVWIGVERSIHSVPTLRMGQRLAESDPPTGRVCVVVPAHNESRVIAGLVGSLRNEAYAQLRVVLALDRCTDDTASLARSAIAGDERFEIVEVNSCPADWAGKVHAVHAGVTRSRGAADAEYLLFADADTLFAPGCIASSLAMMRHRNLDFLSLISTLTYDTWFERVVQIATAFELMRLFPLLRVNGIEDPRAFANGQFMLFTRDTYEAVGGHEAVKDALLEDLAFARRIAAQRRRAGVFVAAGLLHCRMYADWAQFRRGWKRIFTEAASRKARRLSLWSWRIRWLGAIFPSWMLVAGPLGALIVAHDATRGATVLALWLAALLIWIGTLARLCALARAPAWIAPLHIIGAWLTANLLGEAARDLHSRTPTQWGGREYDLRADEA